MSPLKDQTIVFFDGDCGLCSRLVQFIIKRDPLACFRFVPMQSAAAQQIWQRYYKGSDGLQASESDSFAILHNQQLYFKSAAALQVVKRLNGLWPLLAGLAVIPAFIRDAVYDWVAKRRRRWRVSSTCEWNPAAAQAYQERLIDEEEGRLLAAQSGGQTL